MDIAGLGQPGLQGGWEGVGKRWSGTDTSCRTHHTSDDCGHEPTAIEPERNIGRTIADDRNKWQTTFFDRIERMTQQIHRRRVGDTRTVLPVALVQPNASGVLTAVDLTGLSVQFKMVNAATGATEIALTSTGVTVTTAATGQLQYDFSAAGVDTAGVYWGTFVVTQSSETDSFPVIQKDLKIVIDSDTQSGQEAYENALP